MAYTEPKVVKQCCKLNYLMGAHNNPFLDLKALAFKYLILTGTITLL